jgi:hypothetical protein
MTYQPYPSGGGVGYQVPTAQDPPRPPSLRNAVRLMCIGSGVALLGTIVALAASGKIKTEVFNAVRNNAHRSHRSGYTLAQLHTVANITFVALVVAGIVSVLVWVWMAWANNRGSGWARIVASVLFALITIEVILARSRVSVSFVFILLEWLLGLIVVLLLWRRETTEYIGAA